MKEYYIGSSKKTKFLEERKKPVARINPKSLISMKILGCSNGYSLVGPIYIKGAKNGNALKILIRDIKVEKKGNTAGLILNVKNGKVIIKPNIQISLRPNIGVIGVLPYGNVPVSFAGEYGGNMDANDVKEGAIVYLPVFCEGGLLYIGDTHGVMGDGEVWGQGLEIGALVKLYIDIEEKPLLQQPYVVRDNALAIIVSGTTYDEAVKRCINETTDFLCKNTKLTLEEVKTIMNLTGSLEFCQVVCPTKTVRFVLPLKVLKEVLNEYPF